MAPEPRLGSSLLLFSVLSLATFVVYALSISLLLYFLSPLRSLFFTSSVVIVVLTIAVFALSQLDARHGYSTFTATLAACCIGLGLFVFSVFGPVFIDRSISYHLVMFASENGEISISRVAQQTAADVYQKRIREATAAGLLSKVTDDVYRPTVKAKLMADALFCLGWITNSLDEYRRLESHVRGPDRHDR